MAATDALVTAESRLTPAGKRLAVQLALVLPFAHACLHLVGQQTMLRLLYRLSPQPPPCELTRERAAEIAAGVRRIARVVRMRTPLSGTCLSLALALWWILRWQGLDTTLHIGARRSAGEFQAHAWVELLGQPLSAGPRIHARYAVFGHDFATIRTDSTKV